MSNPLYIYCQCKKETELMEVGFPYLAWFDILLVLSKLEVDPSSWFGIDFFSEDTSTVELEPEKLAEWVHVCREAMERNPDYLPDLYNIWRREGDRLTSRGAYFWNERLLMMVDASYHEIIVRPLKPEIAERRLEHLQYDPPQAEEVLPTLKLEKSKRYSDRRPEFTIDPEDFNELFEGTNLFMETTRFQDAVEKGLSSLDRIISHARGKNELILIKW